MERKFIKGECVEDCFDSIDLILQSWGPRLGSYIVGIIPPIPILHHQREADSEGCIFAGILPFNGKISKAFLAIGKYKVKPLVLTLSIASEIAHKGARIECDKPIIVYSSEITVNAGDVVRVTISPANGGEEFLIGILCHPDIAEGEKEKQLRNKIGLLTGSWEIFNV